MKRLIFGIIVAALGLMSFLGSFIEYPMFNSGESTPGEFTYREVFVCRIYTIIMVIGGTILIFFGFRYLRKKKSILEKAYQMLRQDNKIDAYSISTQLGISEVDVRFCLTSYQKKGIISSNVEIV